MQDNDGVAKWTNKYDERGNRTEQAYFDEEGKPCKINDGYAKFTSKYDERGYLIEMAVYNEEDKLCLCNYNFAIWTFKYDERGNQNETAYFDVNREPINMASGFFKEIRVYDNLNNVKETIFTDKDGKLLAEQIFTFQIVQVSGQSAAQKVPAGSIILQWNDWEIGDTQADLLSEEKRSRYGEKRIYYMTQEGEFGLLYIEKGLAGTTSINFLAEKSQAIEWLKQLEDWKKQNQ